MCDAAEEVLRSEADAADAAQRVFTRIWESGDYDRIKRPEHYFRRAGRNEALKMARNLERRRPVYLSRSIVRTLCFGGPSPEGRLLLMEQHQLTLEEIDLLPPRCRLVCALVFIEGFTHAEVADRLDISVKAVEKQVARGRRHIRAMAGTELSTFGDGGGKAIRGS